MKIENWLSQEINRKEKENYIFPKVSVITPSFNQGIFLEDTIRSVLLQDYPNIEFIIIDGGSHDDSVSIIKKYEKFIHFWVSEKDQGQSDAINKGLRIASGTLVCWLNSDDIFLPHAISKVVSHYKENQSKWIVGKTIFFKQNFENLFEFSPRILSKGYKKFWYFPNGWIDYLLSGFSGTFFPQPSTFWEKDILVKIGGIDPELDFAMDHDLTIRLAKAGIRPTILEGKLALLRIHKDRKSSQILPMLNEEIHLLRKYKSDANIWGKLNIYLYYLHMEKKKLAHKNKYE